MESCCSFLMKYVRSALKADRASSLGIKTATPAKKRTVLIKSPLVLVRQTVALPSSSLTNAKKSKSA